MCVMAAMPSPINENAREFKFFETDPEDEEKDSKIQDLEMKVNEFKSYSFLYKSREDEF
jgi:hypothetical protein